MLIPRNEHWATIRMIAALIIVLNHSEHLMWDVDFEKSTIWYFIKGLKNYWQGVPVLFFVSGFLVMLSFKYSNDWVDFFVKRVLRIYPPLWACVFVSSCLLVVLNQVSSEAIFAVWILAQSTLLQFWTPDILRDYGVGTPNGSLWVIPVIVQFYLICPLLSKIDIYVEKAFGKYGALFILFILGVIRLIILNVEGTHDFLILDKIIGVTIIPWLFFFYAGYMCVKYFEHIKMIGVDSRILVLLYIVYITLFNYFYGEDYSGNDVHPFNFILLAIILVKISYQGSFALDCLGRFEAFLKRNDITFGIFVYHMVVANVIYEYMLFDNVYIRLLTYFISTITISLFSMYVLERPIRENRDKIIASIVKFRHAKEARTN